MQNGMVMVPFKQKKKQTVIIIKNTKQKQTNKQTNKQAVVWKRLSIFLVVLCRLGDMYAGDDKLCSLCSIFCFSSCASFTVCFNSSVNQIITVSVSGVFHFPFYSGCFFSCHVSQMMVASDCFTVSGAVQFLFHSLWCVSVPI